MKKARDLVKDVWNFHDGYLGSISASPQIDVTEFMAGIFCPGPYYYYVIDYKILKAQEKTSSMTISTLEKNR